MEDADVELLIDLGIAPYEPPRKPTACDFNSPAVPWLDVKTAVALVNLMDRDGGFAPANFSAKV